MSVTLEIERLIRNRADWYRNRLIPEAVVRIPTTRLLYAGTPRERPYESYVDYFADFISVTDAGYATEYEVKVSRADWKVDLEKPKWTTGFPPYISRFIYVVPERLGIPEWVPPRAGVWHMDDEGITVARNPQRIGKEKVPEKVLERWLDCFYYRYWRLRQHWESHVQQQLREKAEAHLT